MTGLVSVCFGRSPVVLVLRKDLMFGRSVDNPLVSVLLLCYRHEKFVAEAIDGVLSQTYSPLEIFIFDDCSPDHTADVVTRKLAERETRHKVSFTRNCENMSASATRRLALGMMSGDIIFLAHGDDIMRPQMIEEIVRELRRGNVSLVTANAEYIDENSRPLNRTFRDPDVSSDDSFETLARDGSNACCFGATIGFEREIYDKFGYDTDFLGAYDIIFPFYAHLLKGARFLNKILLKYRVHSDNASLSLAWERSQGLERLQVEERIHHSHLAHALLMEEVLLRLQAQEPARYVPVATRILPLLQIQLAEMAKKLVRTKRQAYRAKKSNERSARQQSKLMLETVERTV
jgi:glycosyltransferase involved in cell wall biosynthesis